MFLLWLPILTIFSHSGEGVLSREGYKVTGNNRRRKKTASLLCLVRERGGELWADSGFFVCVYIYIYMSVCACVCVRAFVWTNTASVNPAAGWLARERREQFIYRHHTCDALFWATRTHDRDTDGHGTAGGYVLRRENNHTQTKKGLGRCVKKAFSATEDTLRTFKESTSVPASPSPLPCLIYLFIYLFFVPPSET